MADWMRFVDPSASSRLQTRLNNAKVFIAVDASDSTNWDIEVCMTAIQSEQEFAQAVETRLFSDPSRSRASRSTLHISKWGSLCREPVQGTGGVHWYGDLEGTYPS